MMWGFRLQPLIDVQVSNDVNSRLFLALLQGSCTINDVSMVAYCLM